MRVRDRTLAKASHLRPFLRRFFPSFEDNPLRVSRPRRPSVGEQKQEKGGKKSKKKLPAPEVPRNQEPKKAFPLLGAQARPSRPRRLHLLLPATGARQKGKIK